MMLLILQGGSPSPLWALAHMVLLMLCASTGLAGMIVALVVFGNSETGVLMSTHQVLGLISIGECPQICWMASGCDVTAAT
jgi:hypothetical protein